MKQRKSDFGKQFENIIYNPYEIWPGVKVVAYNCTMYLKQKKKRKLERIKLTA